MSKNMGTSTIAYFPPYNEKAMNIKIKNSHELGKRIFLSQSYRNEGGCKAERLIT